MVDTIYFASSRNSFKFLPTFDNVHHVFLQHLELYSDNVATLLLEEWEDDTHTPEMGT